MKKPAPFLYLLLLAAACFSFATWLQPRTLAWNPRADGGSLLKVLFGDGRRLFANHFFIKADASFHSGYYPSIFDRQRAPKDTRHMTRQEDHSAEKPAEEPEHHVHSPDCKHDQQDREDEHVKQMSFLGPPRDWIEKFGRNFMIVDHSHLEGGKQREMLPWLRISAELDPQRIETYTVAAYWLRSMGKVDEAESFLREGLHNNPESYEILFELGRLYYDNRREVSRARNLWELALKKWETREAGKKEPDLFQLDQIAVHLARLEESQGNLQRAILMLELASKASPHANALQTQIAELRTRLAQPAPAP